MTSPYTDVKSKTGCKVYKLERHWQYIINETQYIIHESQINEYNCLLSKHCENREEAEKF